MATAKKEIFIPGRDFGKFREGDYVRIFLAHGTDTEIHVRAGTILDLNNSISRGRALQLRVEESGELLRRDPREVAVFNLKSGYWVQGRVEMRRVKPYARSYLYSSIAGIEERASDEGMRSE